MTPKQTFWAVIAGVTAIVLYSSAYVVTQVEQVLVLQFGEPQRVVQDPGLKFKVPLVQDVTYFDKRLLDLDMPEQEVTLGDNKRLIVDAYSRYRIENPLRFYQAVRTEFQAENRLDDIINSRLRSVLGNKTLEQVLSSQRTSIMESIQVQVQEEAKALGIDVIDVRIRRADLPQQTSARIFERMISERVQAAKLIRAEGEEIYQQIVANADKEKVVILSEAERESQSIKGKGDAEAYRIYARAFNKDPEFFAFYRSLEAYKKSLKPEGTTFVLSPDSDFFRYFDDSKGGFK